MHEILEKAKSVISNQNNFMQGHYTGDSNGYPTDKKSAIHRYCSIGALHITDNYSFRCMCYLKEGAKHVISSRAIPLDGLYLPGSDYECNEVTYVNDELGHSAVMEMYDKAIELAREQSSE